MPNKANFSAATPGARVTGELVDGLPMFPEVPPQAIKSFGPRITPNFITDAWSADNSYSFFDVVLVDGTSYIATKPVVPAGTEITDSEYWTKWNDPNAQYNELYERVGNFDARITANANGVQENKDYFNNINDRTAEFYGCVPNDPETDNAAAIKTALLNGAYFDPANTYYFSTTIVLEDRRVYDFCSSNFAFNGSGIAISVEPAHSYTDLLVVTNANISVNNNFTYVFNVPDVESATQNKCYFNNIQITLSGASGTVFNIAKGFEQVYNCVSIDSVDDTINDTIGFNVGTTDCVFCNCFGRNIKKYIVENASANIYRDIHAWCVADDLTGTVLFYENGTGQSYIDNVVIDTYETGLFFNIGALSGSIVYIYNESAVNSDVYIYDSVDSFDGYTDIELKRFPPGTTTHLHAFKTAQNVNLYWHTSFSNRNVIKTGMGKALAKASYVSDETNCTVNTDNVGYIIGSTLVFNFSVTMNAANATFKLNNVNPAYTQVFIGTSSTQAPITATIGSDNVVKIANGVSGQTYYVYSTILIISS